jgi:hypothetical protein
MNRRQLIHMFPTGSQQPSVGDYIYGDASCGGNTFLPTPVALDTKNRRDKKDTLAHHCGTK